MTNEADGTIRQIIKQRSDLFEKNFADGNATRLVEDYYVSDELNPVVSAGDMPALIGRKPIAELFENLVTAFDCARQVPRFIRAEGDLAYEISNSYLTPKGGGDEIEYRYIAVWRKCDDTWRVESDFFALGTLV